MLHLITTNEKRIENIKHPRILWNFKNIYKTLKKLGLRARVGESLWCGTSVLSLLKSEFTVSSADLNSADPGTFKRKFTLSVKTPQGETCYILTGPSPTFTPAENVADEDVAPPSIVGTPLLVNGFVIAQVVFDTDPASKTYVAGDEVSVECNLTIAGTALPSVTVKWTVV